MAAEVLTYVEPGYIERDGVAAGALDKEMDKFRLRSNKTVLQGSRFYRNVQARGGKYRESNYGNGLELPRKSEDGDILPASTPIPGFTENIDIVNYRSSIKASRTIVEDQLFPVVRKMMSGQLRSAKLALEYAMADRWNNLTSTAAGYVGADGVAVASATHPHERRETGTWSNIETGGALTQASFSTARKNMRRRTDEFGYVMSVFPRALVVSPDNERKAREIKTSELVPENSLNANNVWRKDPWEVFVYDYLTSTTEWSLWGDRDKEDCGFLMAMVGTPNIKSLEGADKSTDIIFGTRLRMRYATGVLTEKNLQFNAGA